MGIKNSAGTWTKFKYHHPHMALMTELLGVVAIMMIMCVEF